MQKHLRMSKALSNRGGESDAVRKCAQEHPELQVEAFLWPRGGKKAKLHAGGALQNAKQGGAAVPTRPTPRSRLMASVAFEATIHTEPPKKFADSPDILAASSQISSDI